MQPVPTALSGRSTDRPPTLRKHRRLAAAAASLAMLGLAAWSLRAEQLPQAPLTDRPPTVVVVQRVQVARLPKSPLRLPGRFEAVQRSHVGFEVGGVVTAILADAGERVVAGQPLARLDRERAQTALDAATAAEAAAVAQLAELVAGPRTEAIERARAAVAAARAQASLAEATATRTRAALAAAAVSTQDEDQRRHEATIAAATLRGAEAQLAELEAGTRPEQLAAQRANLERLQAERRRLARDLADTELRAPFAGRVSSRTIATGQVVVAGTPAFEVVADDGWRIRVGIPARLAGNGAAILAATATASAAERPVPLAPEAAQLVATVDARVRTVDLLLPIENGLERRDGELVHVTLPEGFVEGVAVPPSALRGGPRGLFRALVATPDGRGGHVAQHRDVQVASWLGERVLVTGGLQPDDLLLVAGADHVLAGMTVQPTEGR